MVSPAWAICVASLGLVVPAMWKNVAPWIVSAGLTGLVIWAFTSGGERVQFLVLMAFSVPLYGFVAVMYGWYLLDKIRERTHSSWTVVGLVIWSLGWLGVVAAMLVVASDLLLGTSIEQNLPRFESAPPAPVMAIGAVIMYVVAGLYCWAVLTQDDSYWAQRVLDLKVFVLWLLAASYLLLASHLLDPIVGSMFGDSARQRLAAMTDSDLNTFMTLGALGLATIVSVVINVRDR
jgi:hypothetical protein